MVPSPKGLVALKAGDEIRIIGGNPASFKAAHTMSEGLAAELGRDPEGIRYPSMFKIDNVVYRLGRILGAGGMGVVYEGTRNRAGSVPVPVAIKFLEIRDPRMREMFMGEIAAYSALAESPHVVRILDNGILEDGRLCVVTELLRGRDVEGIIEQDAALPKRFGDTTVVMDGIPWTVARMIGIQTGDALAAAHNAGIIHRDVKPSNVFVVERPGCKPPLDATERVSVVKLLDFGITLEMGSSCDTGQIDGTPNFMAPEQAKAAKDMDHRADLYALGATIFYALTGQPPHKGRSVVETLVNLMSTDPPLHMLDSNPTLPNGTRGFLEKALQRYPEDRFQSAQEMVEAIITLNGDSGIYRVRSLGLPFKAEPGESEEADTSADEPTPRIGNVKPKEDSGPESVERIEATEESGSPEADEKDSTVCITDNPDELPGPEREEEPDPNDPKYQVTEIVARRIPSKKDRPEAETQEGTQLEETTAPEPRKRAPWRIIAPLGVGGVLIAGAATGLMTWSGLFGSGQTGGAHDNPRVTSTVQPGTKRATPVKPVTQPPQIPTKTVSLAPLTEPLIPGAIDAPGADATRFPDNTPSAEVIGKTSSLRVIAWIGDDHGKIPAIGIKVFEGRTELGTTGEDGSLDIPLNDEEPEITLRGRGVATKTLRVTRGDSEELDIVLEGTEREEDGSGRHRKGRARENRDTPQKLKLTADDAQPARPSGGKTPPTTLTPRKLILGAEDAQSR